MFVSLQHKQRCIALEEQIVELVMIAMERTEAESASTSNNGEDTSSHWLWLHLSSQLIYFVLFQFSSFQNIVTALHEKVFGFGSIRVLWGSLSNVSVLIGPIYFSCRGKI
jgi:hypothetical protein